MEINALQGQRDWANWGRLPPVAACLTSCDVQQCEAVEVRAPREPAWTCLRRQMSSNGVRSTDLAVLELGRRWVGGVCVRVCVHPCVCEYVHVCVVRANDNMKLH